jgi:acetyl-CoA carboxylase biotin carboxyl carrier protein
VPEAVTYREVQEILRTFRDSDWTGMTVELHGMRITVGKQGTPAAASAAASAGTAATATAPAPPAPAPAASPAPAAARASVAAVPATAPAPTGPTTAPTADTSGCIAVASPAVGAFWVAPSPGQPPFVQVGDIVAQDQQLAIVEVMKLMNPVVAPVAGTVVQVCAANADLVEYEQTLFWIRPADG